MHIPTVRNKTNLQFPIRPQCLLTSSASPVSRTIRPSAKPSANQRTRSSHSRSSHRRSSPNSTTSLMSSAIRCRKKNTRHSANSTKSCTTFCGPHPHSAFPTEWIQRRGKKEKQRKKNATQHSASECLNTLVKKSKKIKKSKNLTMVDFLIDFKIRKFCYLINNHIFVLEDDFWHLFLKVFHNYYI